MLRANHSKQTKLLCSCLQWIAVYVKVKYFRKQCESLTKTNVTFSVCFFYIPFLTMDQEWDQLSVKLSSAVRETIKSLNFSHMTPVQVCNFFKM